MEKNNLIEIVSDSSVIEPFIPVELLNQFKQDMISHGYGSFYCFDTFDNGNLKSNVTKALFVGWRVANAGRVKLETDKKELATAICEFRAIFAELLKCKRSETPEDYQLLFDAAVATEKTLNGLVGTNNEFWDSWGIEKAEHDKTALWAVNIPHEPDSEDVLHAATDKAHAELIVQRLHSEIDVAYLNAGEAMKNAISVKEWQGTPAEHSADLAEKWWEQTSFKLEEASNVSNS